MLSRAFARLCADGGKVRAVDRERFSAAFVELASAAGRKRLPVGRERPLAVGVDDGPRTTRRVVHDRVQPIREPILLRGPFSGAGRLRPPLTDVSAASHDHAVGEEGEPKLFMLAFAGPVRVRQVGVPYAHEQMVNG